MRNGAFSSPDDPLDPGGIAKAERFVLPGGVSAFAVSPCTAAWRTAERLGISADKDEALRDIDYGAWSGRDFTDVQTSDPDGFSTWLANPTTGAPDGESLASVQARMTDWLADRLAEHRSMLAITHPMVMRAALAAALDMPLNAALRIDIAPLCVMHLSWNRIWRLQTIG